MHMRISRPAALALAVGALALAGCGGSDGDDAAATDTGPTTSIPGQATTPPASTSPDEASQAANDGPPPVVTTTDTPTGGATPPVGTVTTPPPDEKPKAGGVRPLIKIRDDGTARAVASDSSLAELWCDAARQGAYDDQLGDATTFVIAVRGSDHVEHCDLPR